MRRNFLRKHSPDDGTAGSRAAGAGDAGDHAGPSFYTGDLKDAGHFDNTELRPGQQVADTTLDHPDTRRDGRVRILVVIVATVVLGLAVGAGAGLLTELLYGIEHCFLGFVESPDLPGPFETDWRRRFLSVVVAAVVAAVLWYLLRTKTKKVPSVGQAFRGALMPVWQTVVHVLLQIFIVGAGLSVGREVAPRELGSMFAQRVGSWLRVRESDLHLLVAIAAGAGIGGVYNAPLAGAFFAIEILMVDVTVGRVALAFGCSALAAWTASLIKGTHTFYVMGTVDALYSPDLMLYAVPAGIVLGLLGMWFRRGAQWAERRKASDRSILWMLPLAGLVTGVVAIWVPQVMGNGRATAQIAFSGTPTMSLIPLLLLSFVAKALVTLFTIRSGASGGVLTPGIALGSSMGCILGILWMQLAGTNSIGVYALMGACALLSASQNAPLMAMSLVMELTEAPLNLFIPVAWISIVAVLTAKITEHWHDSPAKTLLGD
ncbi:chloride channel protein [Bifidobacterium choloepi]|uniref:Chloride channel protein n=1 Tax=Bifidobacterium choloepi TaxID=2614131 RepID=A0A6I5NFP6_9BIFI|nr:chloride channel protein [Bifidobacterium choloepi]NEG70164.1 chloride channel protein [Bifidobacterium choloepi]